jgi:hypothetical protein
MNHRNSTASLSMWGIAGLVLAASGSVWADPLPGEKLKFQQLPLGGAVSATVFGHDELSTATTTSAPGVYAGTFAADDFSDNVTSPIVHVQWWGSYIPNPNGTAPANPVQQFLISFESDVPASSTAGPGFSTPGTVLSQQVVSLGALSPASGTFTETQQGGSAAEPLFRYNAELTNPFPEVADTIYWLKIVALTNPNDNIQWGWHNRDYTTQDVLAAPVSPGEVNLGSVTNPIWHFQDDAVDGRLTYIPSQNFLSEAGFTPLYYNNTDDGFPAGAVTPSEDLAFGLYYNVPEPVGLPLLATSLFLLRRQRRQKA